MTLPLLIPDWPAPPNVRAVVTQRAGGVSHGAYASLNLARHVGDADADVLENRRRLRAALGLSREPAWLSQVHGTHIVRATAATTPADGSVAAEPGVACVVLTADCLPVLLCDASGAAVAIAHAGWRGLAAGVIEAAVAALPCAPEQVLAWLGPAIGPDAFEVGDDVRDAFCATDPGAAAAFRRGARPGKHLADLYALARRRLAASGVPRVFGGGYCTWREGADFYSYRRDGATGRFASLIWRAQ